MKTLEMILAGLALAGATLLMGCGSSPEGVVNDFFAAMKDGDVEQMAILGGADAKEAKENPLMVMSAEVLKEAYKGASLKITETKITEKDLMATVAGEVLVKGAGEIDKLTFTLRKVDGKWLMANLVSQVQEAKEQEARAQEAQARLDKGYSDLKQDFETFKKEVVEYREKVNNEVMGAVRMCEDKTAEIAKHMAQVYPQKYVDMLTPSKPEVLIAAEKSLSLSESEKLIEAIDTTQEGDENVNERPKPLFVDKMAELWNSVYGAQVALISVNKHLDSILSRLEQGCVALDGEEKTEDNFKTLSDLHMTLCEEFKNVKAGADVETARKIPDMVKSRGNRWLRDCTETVRRIKSGVEQRASGEAVTAQRQRNTVEMKEESHEQIVATEVKSANDLYGEIKSHEVMQLSWNEALNRLQNLKADFQTDEGRVAVDNAVQAVQYMTDAQAILQRKLKGYEFKGILPKGSRAMPINGSVVIDVTDEKFTVLSQRKGARPRDISWRKFYRDYHENLCEVIDVFIRNGEANGNSELSRQEQARALLGAGLSLNIICGADASSGEYADKIVKDAVNMCPAIRKEAESIFPNVNF